jgi:hypothetical protein
LDGRRCVILYDAKLRLAYLVPLDAVTGDPSLSHHLPTDTLHPPAGWTRDASGFLIDGQPVEFFVINRKLKQTYNVNVLTIFTLPGGAADIRGIAPIVAALPAATPAAPPAAAPPSHGGAGGPLTVDSVVTSLLNEKNFDVPRQSLLNEADGLRTTARELDASFRSYTERLGHLAGTVPGAVPDVQGFATLRGTAAAFDKVTLEFATTFADPADLELERKFDLANLRIGDLLADVQSLNAAVQSFPIVDSLQGQTQSLQYQMESFELGVTAYYNDIETVKAAVKLLRSLWQDSPRYVQCLNDAEIKKDIRSRYSPTNTPTLDDATIARIALEYSNICAGTSPKVENPYLESLRDRLARLEYELNDYAADRVPEPGLLRPRRMRDQYNAAVDLLHTFRSDIDTLNDAEARTLAAINHIYQTYRVLQPTRVDLNLGGNTGNLSVNYAVTGVEQFQPYRIQNQVPQPVTAPQLAPAAAAAAAPAPAPAAPAAASPASPQAPSASSTSSSAAATSTPNPEYVGNFQVHHFTHGTVLAGFAFTNIPNRSYSLVSCSVNCPQSPPVDVITESVQKPGRAVVLGLDIYFSRQDMYPDVHRTWTNRYLPTGLVIGASVDPLNQYLLGVAAEPERGFTYSFGFALGQQNRLPPGQYPGQQVPYATTATGTGTYTAPTLGSASGFRGGVFVMAAFDLNIFQTVFSKVFGGLTNLGPPSTAAAGH